MKHKLNFINSEFKEIRKNHLYRRLTNSNVNGPYITISNKKLLNLSSNDYLGLTSSISSVKQLQSSSRLVSGNDQSFEELEKNLAKHKSHQKALIFPTGYMANLGVIPTVIKKNDLIFSDELNHASIIEACKITGAKISIYKHNDVKDLEKKITNSKRKKFVITEGIFSMDGDFAKLKSIAEIAQKHNAITILDDAHGDFTVGKDGKGTADYFGVSKKIDIYTSSLSKGLGAFGGYIASNNLVVDLCINKSKSFIYTSALPSFLVNYALKRFKSNRKKQQKILQNNVKSFISGLKQSGYQINSKTHIIPVHIGDEKTALKLGKFLIQKGIFAQPIRFPTVPKNKARLRISVTAWLSNNNIEKAISVLESAGKKFKII